jgi:hypothetical protein
MSGLGGLNKSPSGVVVGLVQLQLPVVETPAQLAAQADRIVAMVGKARRTVPAATVQVGELRLALADLARVLARSRHDTQWHRARHAVDDEQVAPDAAVEMIAGLRGLGGLIVEGIFTHLASADEDEIATAKQLDLFDALNLPNPA